MSRFFSTDLELLTPEEAAAKMTLTEKTLANWRSLKIGPPFIRLTKTTIRYKAKEIERWLKRHTQATEENTG